MNLKSVLASVKKKALAGVGKFFRVSWKFARKHGWLFGVFFGVLAVSLLFIFGLLKFGLSAIWVPLGIAALAPLAPVAYGYILSAAKGGRLRAPPRKVLGWVALVFVVLLVVIFGWWMAAHELGKPATPRPVAVQTAPALVPAAPPEASSEHPYRKALRCNEGDDVDEEAVAVLKKNETIVLFQPNYTGINYHGEIDVSHIRVCSHRRPGDCARPGHGLAEKDLTLLDVTNTSGGRYEFYCSYYPVKPGA